mmetsp:Transcript_11430/g.21775  ORF Transcript_11430/g.21775 Transcript_11430/m.21775 type:complete len:358 (+) Transcript_11430:27-1100(+)
MVNPNPPSSRLYVGTPGMTEQELRESFGKFGEIDDISAMRDYSFVQFKNLADAEKAQSELNNSSSQGGKNLVVDFSRNKKEKTDCFNCGGDGHWARDCPRNKGGGGGGPVCYECKQTGHIAKNCPNRGGGDGGRGDYGARYDRDAGDRRRPRSRSPIRSYGRSPPRRGYSPPPYHGGSRGRSPPRSHGRGRSPPRDYGGPRGRSPGRYSPPRGPPGGYGRSSPGRGPGGPMRYGRSPPRGLGGYGRSPPRDGPYGGRGRSPPRGPGDYGRSPPRGRPRSPPRRGYSPPPRRQYSPPPQRGYSPPPHRGYGGPPPRGYSPPRGPPRGRSPPRGGPPPGRGRSPPRRSPPRGGPGGRPY